MAGNIDRLREHMANMLPRMPSINKKHGTKIRTVKSLKFKPFKTKARPDSDSDYD